MNHTLYDGPTCICLEAAGMPQPGCPYCRGRGILDVTESRFVDLVARRLGPEASVVAYACDHRGSFHPEGAPSRCPDCHGDATPVRGYWGCSADGTTQCFYPLPLVRRLAHRVRAQRLAARRLPAVIQAIPALATASPRVGQ